MKITKKEKGKIRLLLHNILNNFDFWYNFTRMFKCNKLICIKNIKIELTDGKEIKLSKKETINFFPVQKINISENKEKYDYTKRIFRKIVEELIKNICIEKSILKKLILEIEINCDNNSKKFVYKYVF